MAQQVPPHDENAERALIGSCLVSQRSLDDALIHVAPDDFYAPLHRDIWAAIAALHLAGDAVDLVTVTAQMRHDGTLRGDTPVRLAELAADAPAGARKHAVLVRDYSLLRQFQQACRDAVEACYDPTAGTPSDIIETAQQEIYQVVSGRQQAVQPVQIGDAVTGWLTNIQDNAGRPMGLPTGLTDLDRKLAGLRAGQLVIVAARPGTGKSLLTAQVAMHVASNDTPVLFCSLEMSKDELAQRLVSARSGIGLGTVRTGTISPRDMAYVADAVAGMADVKLWLLAEGGQTVTSVRAHARRLRVGLVVVDYLQLMTPVGARRSDNRQTDVAGISSGLKRLAMDLGVPVVAAAQLNRSVEYGAEKKPQLSHLRESGAIENDADTVIGIYREDMYKPGGPNAGTAELIVLKQRSGPTGSVEVGYNAETGIFTNLAPGYRYEEAV